MQVDILKRVVEDIAGKQAREIVDPLIGKKDVNEFLIAKKLKLTINQTRNILYKLSDNGLVSFTRKKDKRKGWYIYFWTLSTLKSLEILEKKLLIEAEQLKNQLKNRKIKRFYFCKTCNVEIGEETALLNQFTCAECGQVYTLVEGDKVIKELENKINKLIKTIAEVREEKEKIAKTKEKKIKRKAKIKVKKKFKKKPLKGKKKAVKKKLFAAKKKSKKKAKIKIKKKQKKKFKIKREKKAFLPKKIKDFLSRKQSFLRKRNLGKKIKKKVKKVKRLKKTKATKKVRKKAKKKK